VQVALVNAWHADSAVRPPATALVSILRSELSALAEAGAEEMEGRGGCWAGFRVGAKAK
jgi:hypothetical protein